MYDTSHLKRLGPMGSRPRPWPGSKPLARARRSKRS